MDENPYRAPQAAPAPAEPPDVGYPMRFHLLRAAAVFMSGVVVAFPFFLMGATRIATVLAAGLACFVFCAELSRAFARRDAGGTDGDFKARPRPQTSPIGSAQQITDASLVGD
jgi:hypothetical protein